MTNTGIYQNIANRTGGDIYIGVVGPVRTGKSTFIKRFMETQVIPNIENVYRRPRANRYLASFTHVVRELEDEPSVRDFLVRNFEAFFRRNILPYGRTELPVHFVGSIAAVFESRLREAAAECGCRVGDIVQSPLQRMAEHLRGRGRQ